MENLPPVILTDEDLCLEIVEKGEHSIIFHSKVICTSGFMPATEV
jgi:hypothetical protein